MLKDRVYCKVYIQEGGCEHTILKRIQTGWLKFRGAFRSAYRKRDESEVKRNYLYNMHKTCNVGMAVRHGQQR